MKYLITFNSTAQAIKAESVLLKNDLKIKIRPLPNEISSGCGISIALDDIESLDKVITDNDLKYEKIYSFTNNKYLVIK